MKLSTMLVGALAALTTASTIPSTQEPGMEHELDFSSGVVNRINSFPGAEEVGDILKCMQNHKTWVADWSGTEVGIVRFSTVTPTCCNKARSGWGKYSKEWSRIAMANFDPGCSGGWLHGMTPENIKRLKFFLGDDH